MQYMLIIYSDEKEAAAIPPERMAEMLPAYTAYGKALEEAGVIAGAGRLRPTSAATTVRVRDGRTDVLDGPYSDTKEQLAGYFLVDVADIDQAIAWAARCPGASHGTVEVRPIWPMGER